MNITRRAGARRFDPSQHLTVRHFHLRITTNG